MQLAEAISPRTRAIVLPHTLGNPFALDVATELAQEHDLYLVESNTCGKRFGWSQGDLPPGYDHKYIYSHVGFNLKPTDLQAAISLAQLQRVPGFVEAGRRNFAILHEGLSPFSDRLILPITDPRAEASWFGFPITVHETVSRQSLVRWLETGNIETRSVFGGNILRQPGYRDIEHRVFGSLEGSDRIARDTFFIGLHPGLTEEMLAHVVERFERFFADSRLNAAAAQH